MSAVGLAKARVAVESKKHKKAGGEPLASLQVARRVLAEEKLRQYIERTVASAPPMTASQLDRLRVLLLGGAQ